MNTAFGALTHVSNAVSTQHRGLFPQGIVFLPKTDWTLNPKA